MKELSIARIDIFSSRVYDASGAQVDSCEVHRNVHGRPESLVCMAAFYSSGVHDVCSATLGRGRAAAPEQCPISVPSRCAHRVCDEVRDKTAAMSGTYFPARGDERFLI